MSSRIKILIAVGVVLAFALIKLGDFIDRLRPEAPLANEPNKPLKWTLYPRK